MTALLFQQQHMNAHQFPLFLSAHRFLCSKIQKSLATRLGFAIFVCGLLLLTYQFFGEVLTPSLIGLPWIAVMVSAFYGGQEAGFLTITLSASLVIFRFLIRNEPSHSLSLIHLYRLHFFIFLSLILGWFSSNFSSVIVSLDLAGKHAVFLMDATTLLNSSLNSIQAWDQLAQRMISQIGEGCAIELLHSDQFKRVTIAHSDPSWTKNAEVLLPSFFSPSISASNAPQILHSKDYSSSLTEAQVMQLRELNIHSILITPLVAHEKILGILSFFPRKKVSPSTKTTSVLRKN